MTEAEVKALQDRVKAKAIPMLERALTMGLKPRPEGLGTSGLMSMIGPPSGPQPVVIDIDPIGAPRQTRRDAWAPSKAVQRYRSWKDKFRPACEEAGWKLESMLHADFEVEMPASWSKKKKAAMLGSLHHQKPDIDNMTKAVMDAFGVDDGHVACLRVVKRWAEKGRIILYR